MQTNSHESHDLVILTTQVKILPKVLSGLSSKLIGSSRLLLGLRSVADNFRKSRGREKPGISMLKSHIRPTGGFSSVGAISFVNMVSSLGTSPLGILSEGFLPWGTLSGVPETRSSMTSISNGLPGIGLESFRTCILYTPGARGMNETDKLLSEFFFNVIGSSVSDPGLCRKTCIWGTSRRGICSRATETGLPTGFVGFSSVMVIENGLPGMGR